MTQPETRPTQPRNFSSCTESAPGSDETDSCWDRVPQRVAPSESLARIRQGSPSGPRTKSGSQGRRLLAGAHACILLERRLRATGLHPAAPRLHGRYLKLDPTPVPGAHLRGPSAPRRRPSHRLQRRGRAVKSSSLWLRRRAQNSDRSRWLRSDGFSICGPYPPAWPRGRAHRLAGSPSAISRSAPAPRQRTPPRARTRCSWRYRPESRRYPHTLCCTTRTTGAHSS